MKSNEFITNEEELNEIERLKTSGYPGGASEFGHRGEWKKIRLLPGASGFKYSVKHIGNTFIIKMFDPSVQPLQPLLKDYPGFAKYSYPSDLKAWKDRQHYGLGEIIGELTVEGNPIPGYKNAVKVGTINVRENYRGMGVAKALYGIVLSILKLPLVAGASQTPGGRRNWLSLAKIPG